MTDGIARLRELLAKSAHPGDTHAALGCCANLIRLENLAPFMAECIVELAEALEYARDLAEIITDSNELAASAFDAKWFDHPWYAAEYENISPLVLQRIREALAKVGGIVGG